MDTPELQPLDIHTPFDLTQLVTLYIRLLDHREQPSNSQTSAEDHLFQNLSAYLAECLAPLPVLSFKKPTSPPPPDLTAHPAQVISLA
jgi:hypothetical protein